MYFIYVLQSQKDNNLYIGYTCDIDKRIDQHTKGNVKSTKNRRPIILVYFEACRNQQDALHRERYLKSTYGHRYLKNRLKNDINSNYSTG